ncbi:MAG: stage II sporulation protein M [Planctomycetaceae bacterium]|nr:stage II sporulation protein M [Planctomycetaceae bacterium]
MSNFIGRYKKDWEELESLIRRGQKSVRRLTPEQRERLDVLYRRTTVHLARVSTLTQDQALITYLNGLTASAHSLLYLAPRGNIWGNAVHFVSEGFPRAIARQGRAHALSALLLLGGAMIGYLAASSDPLTMHALWPAGDTRQPGSTAEQLTAHLRAGREEGGGFKFFFASFLFQHNLKVALLAMATGVLASVPTVFLMILNGMLLGVFVAIHHQVGIQAELWAWLLPHGITEIGAIMLCGGVGLMLGQAVVHPGRQSRRAALLHAGRESIQICLGVAGMLFAAAIIESYVRQSHWSTNQRLLFAAATALFWAVYIAHGARREYLAGRALAGVTTDSADATR